eukprot:2438019-Prymnesium_polylepis.1
MGRVRDRHRERRVQRRPESESIDLFNRSIDCARCKKTRVCGGHGVNRGNGGDWNRCVVAKGVA